MMFNTILTILLQVICISDSKQPFGKFEDCQKIKNSPQNLLNILKFYQ